MNRTREAMSDAEGERLRRLAHGLGSLHSFHRFVDYREAEGLAKRLALRLRREVGEDGLAAATFAAIPRGGLLVLGMLAYLLDLAPEQLDRPAVEVSRVVVVDDCALSGLRLRQSLERFGPATSIVVAHLLSTPGLRQAVVAAEPRVEACVAAANLVDRTRQLRSRMPPERFELLARRFGRDRRYWFGVPELVSFAWSEPARLFWNEATHRVEDGWRLTPPHRCLKSFARLARHLPCPAVDPPAVPAWRSAETVVWGEFDEVLWLVDVVAGGVYSLTGAASVVWKCLVTGGDAAGATAAVIERFATAGEAAAADVESLVAELAGAGLIERADG